MVTTLAMMLVSLRNRARFEILIFRHSFRAGLGGLMEATSKDEEKSVNIKPRWVESWSTVTPRTESCMFA